MKVFEKEPLEKLIFVTQTGGKNTRVTGCYVGVESFLYGALLFNRIKLTKKGVVYVFRHSDEKYLGYIVRGENDLPEKHFDEDGSEFKDWYTTTYKGAYPNG